MTIISSPSRFWPLVAMLILLVLLAQLSGGIFLTAPVAHAASTGTTSNIIAIDPPGISSTSYTPGSQVAFSVSLTQPSVNPSQINGFTIGIQYNTTILQAISIDYNGTVLANNPGGFQAIIAATECINGKGIGVCTISTGGGVELSLQLLGTLTNPPTNGILFRTTFMVTGTGFSQLHLVRAVLVLVGTQLSVDPHDGYFANIDCGGNPCKPPVPIFTYSPTRPIAGSNVEFNASSSWSPNLYPSGRNASIVAYKWEFGDGQPPSEFANPDASRTFSVANNYTVTLTIVDSYGTVASLSVLVPVISILIDIAIGPGELIVSNSVGVIAGTLVNITARFHNFSTQSVNDTLEIRVENSLLTRRQVSFSKSGSTTLTTIWPTAGARPRVYRLVAMADPVRNSTTGQIIENETSNNFQVVYVQILEPLPLGFGIFLGAGLTTTFGLAVLVIVVVGGSGQLVWRSIRRKPVL